MYIFFPRFSKIFQHFSKCSKFFLSFQKFTEFCPDLVRGAFPLKLSLWSPVSCWVSLVTLKQITLWLMWSININDKANKKHQCVHIFSKIFKNLIMFERAYKKQSVRNKSLPKVKTTLILVIYQRYKYHSFYLCGQLI